MPDLRDKKAPMLRAIPDIAERMVRAEMAAGHNRDDAERVVAKRAGVAKTALERLRRGRIKHVETFGSRIRAAYIRGIERQISALETELAYARALDRPIDFDAVEDFLRRAKEALAEGRG